MNMTATMTERMQREHIEKAKDKKVWEPQVVNFLGTAVIGGALTYGTVLVVGAATTASGVVFAGWVVLGLILGTNALGCFIVAIQSLFHSGTRTVVEEVSV
jgi:hypothetical protein